MHGGNQSSFVATDIEDGEFAHRSAWGNVSRNLAKFAKRFFRMIPYQCASDDFASGCFSENSFRRFLVMMCMIAPLRSNAA
jgi:hypothetical protein